MPAYYDLKGSIVDMRETGLSAVSADICQIAPWDSIHQSPSEISGD